MHEMYIEEPFIDMFLQALQASEKLKMAQQSSTLRGGDMVVIKPIEGSDQWKVIGLANK